VVQKDRTAALGVRILPWVPVCAGMSGSLGGKNA
jgi:hypothetical protein